LKVVYATDQYWPCVSGVSASIDLFREELVRLGHQVHILAPEYPGAGGDPPWVHRFRSSKVFFNDENRLVLRSESRHLADSLRELEPDIVHVQTEFALGAMATRWARRRGIPVVVSAHTNWLDLIGFYLPWLPHWAAVRFCRWKMATSFNKAEAVVVPTSLMDTLLSAYGIRRPTRVIPTGVRPESLRVVPDRQPDPRTSHPALADGRILLFVGRLGLEKNIPFLFEVLQRLLPGHPDLRLLVVGDGPARLELESLAAARGLADRVVFAGFVPHGQLAAYYESAEIFVFPSKVEAQGLVVLEAMSCGTPVVAIGRMGTREVMGGSHGGFMVEDDVEDFVAASRLLLSNPQLRERKRNEALEHAADWTMSAQARRMVHLYQAVRRKKGAGRKP
jgi:glycosyltransferase involved in cell wall biosynthesis